MTVYHMSQTLVLGENMKNDFEKKAEYTLPFVHALEIGMDFFCDVAANGQAKKLLPDQLIHLDRSEYIKWCVEGVFEFVRKEEFPNCPSRINCKYFFDDLENFKILYEAGWKQEPEEKRAKLHLYEIELDEEPLQKFDMCIYDKAYDAMAQKQYIAAVLSCARRYFSKAQSETPIWEIMSDRPAKAVKDISSFLKGLEE